MFDIPEPVKKNERVPESKDEKDIFQLRSGKELSNKTSIVCLYIYIYISIYNTYIIHIYIYNIWYKTPPLCVYRQKRQIKIHSLVRFWINEFLCRFKWNEYLNVKPFLSHFCRKEMRGVVVSHPILVDVRVSKYTDLHLRQTVDPGVDTDTNLVDKPERYTRLSLHMNWYLRHIS